jgi:hypothetical protein
VLILTNCVKFPQDFESSWLMEHLDLKKATTTKKKKKMAGEAERR